MIVSKIWIFKLPDIDQAYKNMSYKRKRSFKRFWKKYEEKRKKNSILVYLGLRYTHKILKFACKIFFFKKCLFEYENQFAVEKTQKIFGGNFKNT